MDTALTSSGSFPNVLDLYGLTVFLSTQTTVDRPSSAGDETFHPFAVQFLFAQFLFRLLVSCSRLKDLIHVTDLPKTAKMHLPLRSLIRGPQGAFDSGKSWRSSGGRIRG